MCPHANPHLLKPGKCAAAAAVPRIRKTCRREIPCPAIGLRYRALPGFRTLSFRAKREPILNEVEGNLLSCAYERNFTLCSTHSAVRVDGSPGASSSIEQYPL